MHDRATFLKLLGAAAVGVGAAGCAPPTRSRQVSLATGPPEGLWNAFGTALAKQWRARSVVAGVDVLAGYPVVNARSLLAGQVDIGIDAADSAQVAIDAAGAGLLALGRIYDDYVQVVVRADSGLQRMAELRGKKVWVNAPDVAPLPSTENLLIAAGLTKGTFTAVESPTEQGFASLIRREIDAVVFSAGLPTPGIVTANKQSPLRLIDQSDVLPGLRRRYSVYGAATIPSSVYDMSGPAPTVTTLPNYLLSTSRLSNDFVSELLEAMFANRSALIHDVPVAVSLDQNAAIATAPIPLHPGAIAYYRASRP